MDDFNAFGHVVIGLSLGVLVADSGIAFLLVACGSLLPDIDHPNSTFGKYNLLHKVGARKRKRARKNNEKAPPNRFVKHRGKCHTVFGAMLLCSPFMVLGPIAYSLVLYGAFTHLLADKAYSWLPKKRKFQLKMW